MQKNFSTVLLLLWIFLVKKKKFLLEKDSFPQPLCRQTGTKVMHGYGIGKGVLGAALKCHM